MLVLSRKLGERVYVWNNVCVTVVEIRHKAVRIGIQAPRSMTIFGMKSRPELAAASPDSTRSKLKIHPEMVPVLPPDRLGGMYVLTRKISEAIRIGEHVFITLVSIDGSKVRLGFDAPLDVPIYRQELLQMLDPPMSASPNDDHGGSENAVHS